MPSNYMPYYNMPYAPYNVVPSASPNLGLQHYDIIQVNGKAGVDAFQMGPNSRVLLLDETAPIVWLAQTDGAGYKTATPYTLTPYQQPTPVDVNNLAQRLTKLEERYEQLQSHSKPNKSGKQQRQQSNFNESTSAADTASQSITTTI